MNKTRLFVTNQNHFLPFATRVIVFKGGKIAHQGTYDELVAQGVDFASLVEDKKPKAGDAPGSVSMLLLDDSIADSSSEVGADAAKKPARVRKLSEKQPLLREVRTRPAELERNGDRHGVETDVCCCTACGACGGCAHCARVFQEAAKLIQASVPVDDDKKKAPSKLIEKEERETGVVGGHIYWAYIVASGGILFVVLYVKLLVRAHSRCLFPLPALAPPRPARSHHLTSLRRALFCSSIRLGQDPLVVPDQRSRACLQRSVAEHLDEPRGRVGILPQ